MLNDGRTSGTFYSANGGNAFASPGKRDNDNVKLRIRDAAFFTGELYHISGTKEDAKARISTDTYGVVFCTTTREIAKDLRQFLFEDVKVSGRGMWTRSEDGTWDIDEFFITDYTPINRENIRSAVDRIRVMGIRWPDKTLMTLAIWKKKAASAIWVRKIIQHFAK